jgi:hypothetical protein
VSGGALSLEAAFANGKGAENHAESEIREGGPGDETAFYKN